MGFTAIGFVEIIDFEIVTNKFNSFKEWYGLKNPGKEISELKFLKYELSHHLVDIAEILFFLLGNDYSRSCRYSWGVFDYHR